MAKYCAYVRFSSTEIQDGMYAVLYLWSQFPLECINVHRVINAGALA